ncbi:MAG TPA: M20/M25/M40 family metallo-hydrolase [Bacteroidales bacterium]|nr:M20/M25/M40 family metallo-hydrolase [Bacteroidales bacterium]
MKYLLPITFVLISLSFSGSVWSPQENSYAVLPSELREWVLYLASDNMKGRRNGSTEMEEAAVWISGKFNEYETLPLQGREGYLYPYQASARGGSVSEKNVVAAIEGTDPELKNEYIILTAHFDHIGIRGAVEGDSIYNGADDNAAGTCTLLGIAKTIKEKQLKPGRTIIFAAFSGEEIGLRGSRYFVQNSPISLDKIYANLNFEMTGHSEYLGRDNFYMAGCSNSNLDDIIHQFNSKTSYRLIDTIALEDRLFFMSDNLSFARVKEVDGVMHGIPCGTFATTTFADYIHSPGDEVDLFDFDNMASLVDHFSNLVIWLSRCTDTVDWTDPGFERLK